MAQIKKSDNSKCWWRCGEMSDVSYVELWVMWRNEWCELCGVMSDVEKRVMWVMWSYEWCGEMSDVSYVALWVMWRNEWCELCGVMSDVEKWVMWNEICECVLTCCSGECKWCSCFGKQFGSYHKFKYIVSTRPRNLIYTQVDWGYVHAKTYTWCHSRTIHSSPKV